MNIILFKNESKKITCAKKVCEVIGSHGYEAFFVGGCVRDALLDNETMDIDIATNARPEIVEDMFDHTQATGKKFGTITVIIEEYKIKHSIEVTTYRSEGIYSNQRHPDTVVFEQSLEKDVLRRDFTANALAYDPLERRLMDFVGGIDDIQNKLLRVVGDPDQRFQEDSLRLIRCCRFIGQLEFSCEPKTWKKVCTLSPTITMPSWERITNELEKCMQMKHAFLSLQAFEESCLLERLFPGLSNLNTINKQVFDEGNLDQRWSLLLSEAQTAECLEQFRWSKQRKKWLASLVKCKGDMRKAGFSVTDLALSGHDLVALGYKGKEIGNIQKTLMGLVFRDFSLNTKDNLLKQLNKKNVKEIGDGNR